MPTTDFLSVPLIVDGDTDGAVEKLASMGDTFDAALEFLLRSLCDPVGNTILSGWTVTDGTGLAVSVAAGRGALAWEYCVTSSPTAVSGLTDNATNYIFATAAVNPNGDKTVTFSHSTSGAVPARSCLLATVTTSGGDVTAVNTAPVGRPPLSTNRSRHVGIAMRNPSGVLTAGQSGWAEVPYGGNIAGYILTGMVNGVPTAGALTLHVEYAAPGAIASPSAIDGGGAQRPILSAAAEKYSTTISAWTTAVDVGGHIYVEVDVADGVLTDCNLTLLITT